MNEQPGSGSNVPPLKEFTVRIIGTDAYLTGEVLSEKDERYVVRFSDGRKQTFSKEIVVPGNKIGIFEFVSFSALNRVNQPETGETSAFGELSLIRIDSNPEVGGSTVLPQTSNSYKLKNDKSIPQTDYKFQTNIDNVTAKTDQELRKSGGTRNKVSPKKRNRSPSYESKSSGSFKSLENKRAVPQKRMKRNQNAPKASKNVANSEERSSSPQRKTKKCQRRKQVTNRTQSRDTFPTDYNSIPYAAQQDRHFEHARNEVLFPEATHRNSLGLESRREEIFRHSPENDFSRRRNRSSDKYAYNRRSDNSPNYRHDRRQYPGSDASAVNQNDEYRARFYGEPDSGRYTHTEHSKTIIDTRQAHNCSNIVIEKSATDEQFYCSPSKRFITLFILIIVCVYFMERRSRELKSQILFFSIGNSYISDILGSVYVSFFVIAVFAPSSKLITSCCKSLALVYLFLLNYTLLRIVVSQTQQWKEVALNVVIPCIMQMLYSILALCYQSSGRTLLSGAVHRVLILISPVVVTFPTIGSFHCRLVYEWFTIYSGCTLYCVGLIIWILTKIEFRNVDSTNRVIFYLGRETRLVLPRVVNCRHPHYLGIIFMNIGCSLIACSMWSIIIPLLVTIFLTANANKWDNYYRSVDYISWNIYERHVRHSVFPFHF